MPYGWFEKWFKKTRKVSYNGILRNATLQSQNSAFDLLGRENRVRSVVQHYIA